MTTSKGYKPQTADFNVYSYEGKHVDRELLSSCIAVDLADNDNATEILALMNEVYRPEQLHANGDINDAFNPEGIHLARVTKEARSTNHADLCEQASFEGGQWSHLAQSYQSFVKRTQRWINGYKPEHTGNTETGIQFAEKVERMKLKMRKNRKLARNMRNKWESM